MNKHFDLEHRLNSVKQVIETVDHLKGDFDYE